MSSSELIGAQHYFDLTSSRLEFVGMGLDAMCRNTARLADERSLRPDLTSLRLESVVQRFYGNEHLILRLQVVGYEA